MRQQWNFPVRCDGIHITVKNTDFDKKKYQINRISVEKFGCLCLYDVCNEKKHRLIWSIRFVNFD